MTTALPLLTDTHCHLVSDKLFNQADDLVQTARDNGVNRIINIAYNKETIDRGFDLAERHSDVWTTLGIQPHDASSYSYELAESLVNQFQTETKLVAIGEIGLDAFYTLSPMKVQMECFEHFLDVACRLKKPVVIHVRETHREVHQRLKAHIGRGLQGVIHCFTGTLPEAREFLDLGFSISFSGIVTFKKSNDLREVARFVPQDRILVETDSPYLAPTPHRGKLNQPAFVRHTANLLSEIRGIDPQEFALQTTENATQLFKLDPPNRD